MRFRYALIAAYLLGAAATSAAEPVVFSSPRAAEPVLGGEQVEVRWSGVPSGAEEMELLLSLDGGQRIALRLTSEIPVAARSFSWKVPNLVCSRASLVLRIGSLGRETIVGASAPFTILPDPSLGFEAFVARSGELWLSSRTDSRDPLGAAGAAPVQDAWDASGPWGSPASCSSSSVLPSPSRARISRISPASSPRTSVRAGPLTIPPPAPTLRI